MFINIFFINHRKPQIFFEILFYFSNYEIFKKKSFPYETRNKADLEKVV